MIIIIILIALLSSCYNSVKTNIPYETVKEAVYFYKGITINDNLGNEEFVQEVVNNINMLEILNKFNLLISNNITNIVITWQSNDHIAWVYFPDGIYVSDTIYLNGYYYFHKSYYYQIYPTLIHECYHIILRKIYKEKEIPEASERICQMMAY